MVGCRALIELVPSMVLVIVMPSVRVTSSLSKGKLMFLIGRQPIRAQARATTARAALRYEIVRAPTVVFKIIIF